MKASDLFIKALEAEGIEYIFGIPGEENRYTWRRKSRLSQLT
jgi:thiamine pyrophosphate-dependent acetolactate synthase large subunit-like protein